ncbi:DUF3783 domain-containing protein [Clostridium perfringens]|uniref:DUF3783 domain-containing protein n=1 Tax=Clostridium perfringens TaxID=1502 RepID=UPI0030D0D5F9
MSFERIDISDRSEQEGRSCVILYNFGNKELKKIQNFARIMGIKDQIVLNSKNGDETIKNILEDKIEKTEGEGVKERAIIFNAIAPGKVHIFLENLKKVGIQRSLVAMVTETSINWTIDVLVKNLIAERRALRSGDMTTHENNF